ncbi:hypothetical protein [uncultured Acinetobacter sp.]|uniref:hypothetical protein n=1 Tax=uncultured Acinetobacter sp. TaxID=165433 RepID=UPI002628C1F6|nr:hypothetical protein [uncultured Acinetobacter sp.]
MPIPSPADFRNKSKKHSEVREMLAQMAESVESKTEVENKFNSVKNYVDDNKLDLSKIIYEYVDGNKIGPKTPRYTNLGISGGILVGTPSDSLVLHVKENDVLYMHNDTQKYTSALGSRFMFFAEDPNLNRTQTNIAHTATKLTDAASSIIYQKVTVPTGAKYLMINTRTVSAGVTYNLNWAVHKDSFSSSFVPGTELVSAIQGVPVGASGDDLKKAKEYTDAQLVDIEKLKTSTKNLFTGEVITKRRINSLGAQRTSSDNDVVSNFVPVVSGSYYTISGLDLSLIPSAYQRISGYSEADLASNKHVKQITNAVWTGNTCTFLVDDPAIKFVLFPLSNEGFGTLAKALELAVQAELGQVATSYEPYKFTSSELKLYKAGLVKSAENTAKLAVNIKPKFVNNFIEVNKVRNSISTLTSLEKNISPLGIGYSLNGSDGIKNKSNVLYAQIPILESGSKSIYAHMATYIQSTMANTKLKSQPFTVPSGQVDNPDSIVDTKIYNNAEYCHPSIAYDSVGVAGFKYWMIASILPVGGSEGVTWEDEDLFVSNDAKNWQRVRSLYESDKSYTTTQLRLPPHSLTTASARKHAFLPCPAAGDVIEISVLADNGAPALDRVDITIIPTAWKHDPVILIDGGYVYTYHSFHLPYSDRTGGSNRFIVCVRTNNGIDWDVVRTDGSTMRLTEETSRQIFTKDAQGRYNYMYYAYSRGYSNPEVIKWGANDYEFYYGGNFSFKVKGATPYNFDFSTHYPVQEKGAGNHPGLLRSGNDLYLATNDGFYKSIDRGATFTALDDYPFWLGGFTGLAYKKALCIGEGGKVILVEAQRFVLNGFSAPVDDNFSTTNNSNLMFVYEYASVAELISMANKLNDAYVDIQLYKVNYADSTRQYYIKPALSMTRGSGSVHNPLQRVKITDIECKSGDILHVYLTLNARNAASVNFGGIEIV